MTETQQQEKRVVTPGLVKSESYTKKSKNYTINPTLQVVTEELPVAEKSVLFTEHLVETLDLAPWAPPEGELNITAEMISVDVNMLPSKPKTEKKPKIEKLNKTRQVEIPVEKYIEKPTEKRVEEPQEEFEYIKPKRSAKNQEVNLKELQSAINEIKPTNIRPKAVFEIPANTELPKDVAENVSKTNVFETINTIRTTPEAKSDNTNELKQEKPFMVVDNTEIRTLINDEGENIYMIGNKKSTAAQFSEYIQSISGKILALECKNLQIGDDKYTLQKDGTYKDNIGNTLSVDDMLERLHG